MHTMGHTMELYRKIYAETMNAIRDDPALRSKLTKEQIEFIELVRSAALARTAGGQQTHRDSLRRRHGLLQSTGAAGVWTGGDCPCWQRQT